MIRENKLQKTALRQTISLRIQGNVQKSYFMSQCEKHSLNIVKTLGIMKYFKPLLIQYFSKLVSY